jgi:cyclase
MRAITGSLLLSLVCLALPASTASAQDLGPKFKRMKEGIFTYTGKSQDSNCTIILTQEGVVLIDSGHYPPDSRLIAETIKKLTPLPVKLLINTEPHADHTTGHYVFSPPALIVAAAGATESMKAAYRPQRAEQMAAESPEMKAAMQGYKLITPHIEYRDRMTLNVGERTFELHYLKNIHSESDTATWMPKERILFPAASVGFKRVGNLRPAVTIPDTMAAIKMMRALNPEIVIPGHGEPGTVKILDDMERYYNALLARVREEIAKGKTLDQLKKEMKIMPEYADWDGQDRFDTNIDAAWRAIKGG